MDVEKQDFFFWQLVQRLVIKHKMKIIEINAGNHEVWLKDERSRKNQIVHLIRSNRHWANHLRRDVEQGAIRFELLRRHFFWRRLKGVQIVVLDLPTVDSSDEIENQTLFVGKRRKTMTSTVIIDSEAEQKISQIKRLFRMLEIDDDQYDWLHHPLHSLIEEMNKFRIEATKQENERKQKAEVTLIGKPIVTFALLIINLILFALLERNGGSSQILTLIEFGAKYNPLIEEGQWWRFFTAMFLHIGILHLLMNSFALYFLGNAVERIYGSGRFVVIYFTAGLLGSIVSFSFSEQVSAGASGAIYGLFGALLYLGVRHREFFFRTLGWNLIIVLAVNLAFGFLMPMVDNHAHIGGLVGGYLASMVVNLPKQKKRFRQIGYLALTSVVIFGFYLFGLQNENKYGSVAIHQQIAYELIDLEEFQKAKQILNEVTKTSVDSPELFFLLSYAEIQLEELEQAKQDLLTAISLKENFHEAHFNLALVYAELAQYDAALESMRQALKYDPTNEKYKENLPLFENMYGESHKDNAQTN